MSVLSCCCGNGQALKPIIAAHLAEPPEEVRICVESTEANGADSTTVDNSFASLRLKSGGQLTDFTAMAEALWPVSQADPILYSKVQQWVEWENCVLKPVVYSQQCSTQLPSVLQKLDGALQTRKDGCLVMDAPSLADVVIFATLFPLRDESYIPQSIKGYLERLFEKEAFARGVEKLLGSEKDETLLRKFLDSEVARLASASPKLPIPGQRNIMVTSALPYVNNVPHLGNIIGCVLSADCYARFCRACGYQTIFVCGTDEYGTATETKAYEEGVTCEEICDKYFTLHKKIYDWFGISCDKFGRTPTRHQTKIAQDIFLTLKAHSKVVENEMQQLFSVALGKFLADRFIVGTCPKCGFEDARGDQCENCGSLLNPTELLNPKCKLTGTTPVLKTTKHVFLDLPELSDELKKYIEETSQQGGWSSNCLQITNAWMRDGLKQRCITRDLKWGIPVPLEGYEDKVFYVWFDAPIGYISITADYTSQWELWWKNPKDVELVQFMGKDNVPFHTVIFPATLLGTQQSWTMMKKISVTEYLNYESGKFSKSRGTGVFGDNAMESGIPSEVWRFYLLANRPEQQDSTFSWENLGFKNNSELLNNFGNLINRALKFVEKFYNRCIPPATDQGKAESLELGNDLFSKITSFIEKMESIQIRAALAIVMDVAATGNKYIQDHKPWELIKENPEECQTVVKAGTGIAKILAALAQPFMPTITDKILHQLNLNEVNLKTEELEKMKDPCSLLPDGHLINEPVPLFMKITDEQLDQFRERFKGKQPENSETLTKKKEKKQKTADSSGKKQKAGESSKQKQKSASDDKIDISRLDLRVGFIEKAWKHPDADSLYVEEIHVGEVKPRTVVSGLVKFIPEEAMQKRRVILICNMKPVNMRGIKSEAMVLAATSPDGNTVELIEAPEGVTVGEKVSLPGFEGEADEVLKPKQKVFEAVQPDLHTNAQRVACYKEQPFMTSKGECTVNSIVHGSIK